MSEAFNLPPNSIEAEQGILGCLLLDNQEIDSVVIAGLDRGWFFDPRHCAIWDALAELHADRKPCDMITVGDRMRVSGTLDRAGGLAYLSSLMDAVPSSANASYYLDIVRDKHRRRRVATIAHEALDLVRGAEETSAVLDRLESDILSIRTEHSPDNDKDAKSVIRGAIDSIEESVAGRSSSIRTGWTYLDRVTKGGFRPGQMIVVAGRPGTGKTAFAISLMMQMARDGIPSGIISLEMSSDEIGQRMLAIESGIDPTGFDPSSKPTDQQYRALVGAAGRTSKMRILVNDKPNATMSSIAAKARRWVRRDGIRLLVVDYLQLVEPSRKSNSRQDDVASMSRAIKLMAKELQIPVMVLCQLNRDIERDKGRKPRLSDLRESGAIEQDADLIGMLHHASERNEEATENTPIDINLYVGKNRGGITGVDVRFTFSRWITRFDPWKPTVDTNAR